MNEDPLSPARGCVYGVALGALFWVVVFVIAYSLSR